MALYQNFLALIFNLFQYKWSNLCLSNFYMQLDKRKKLEDEAGVKAVEAESHYRSCVEESNARHRNLLAVKSQVVI